MTSHRVASVVVIGAGVGGLTVALLLANAGLNVTVLERAATPGGKLSKADINGATIDVGPTVFTMRWVFEGIFAAIGERLQDAISLTPLTVIARHSWSASERLDLFANIEQSAAAIAQFSSFAESRRFIAFCAHAKRIYDALETPFIRAPQPSLGRLIVDLLPRRPLDLWAITPFRSLWRTLGDYFHDPRLRQLFGRYSTYCGGSPWLSPGTLMLVSHVEQSGVWSADDGMYRIAQALADRAVAKGATMRYGTHVAEIRTQGGKVNGIVLQSGEFIAADVVISNADVAAFSAGLFGESVREATPRVSTQQRSLSAFTLALTAKTEGFPLHRHNVFFSNDYKREFTDIADHARIPESPTVYVCAQDRDDSCVASVEQERLFCIVNAPAIGDTHVITESESERCQDATFMLLNQHGVRIERDASTTLRSTPTDFAHRFPGTGGALYGRAPHGWMSSFQRPSAKSRVPGLYLTGGSTHPGPGIAMAALSGQMAAQQVLKDLALTGK
jgi:1-hydroxycarotenoid 3,4-desaturase